MANKATRLRFEAEDLEDGKVAKAAEKAEKAADRADKAIDKLPTESKLRRKSSAEESAGKKLRFGKADVTPDGETVRPGEPVRGSAKAKAGAATSSGTAGTTAKAGTSTAGSAGAKTTASAAGSAAGAKAAQGVKVEGVTVTPGGETAAKARPNGKGRKVVRAPIDAASGVVHREAGEYQDDNVGLQAANETEGMAEGVLHEVDHAGYSRKLKKYDKAEKLVKKSDNANTDAIYRKKQSDESGTAANPVSGWMQKRQIKKEYAAAKRTGESTATAANAAKGAGKTAAKGADKAAQGAKDIGEKIGEFASHHMGTIITVGACAVLILLISSGLSSCSVMFGGAGDMVLETSYAAEDEDILAVDADYTALETALRNRINSIESDYPDYDEYRYDLDEIGHNPFELASYLTAVLEDYTEDGAQAQLQKIFDLQYDLSIEKEVEIRTRTETRTGTRMVTKTGTRTVTKTGIDEETGEEYEYEAEEEYEYQVPEEYEYEVEVEYEYYILNVTLDNRGLGTAVGNAGLTADQMERYALLNQTYGNKKYLFEDSIYAVADSGEYGTYEIPAEALTDEKFARMIAEAEKYLGYPYVWGGSSPSTSFDCSGYVSWVINNCGNGWSVGRLTANGLLNICTRVSRSEAKPGDLVFFQGTYDTSGASHVGIYVGDGMMIHCGNPIQYTSIETLYWQEHFLCFGRLS